MYGTYGDTGNFMEYLQSATYFFKDNDEKNRTRKKRKKEKEKHRKRVEKRNERKKKSKKKNKVEKVPRSRATCFTFRRIT